jgi:hypothetical protein
LLGKITEAGGFIPSEKNILRTEYATPKVDIKTFGLYAPFETLLKEEIPSLIEVFGEERAHTLLAFAMMRCVYQSPINRHWPITYTISSEHWSRDIPLSDKYVSSVLNFVGERRELVLAWMRLLLPSGNDTFVLMDSTHVMSASEHLAVNAKGYNGAGDFGKQVRLRYLFQAKRSRPVYYHLVNGNITDISSMSLWYICQIRIHGEWKYSEIPQRVMELFGKIKIDNLT